MTESEPDSLKSEQIASEVDQLFGEVEHAGWTRGVSDASIVASEIANALVSKAHQEGKGDKAQIIRHTADLIILAIRDLREGETKKN